MEPCLDLVGSLREAGVDGKGGATGLQRRVFGRPRDAKDRHDAVAAESMHRAIVLADAAGELVIDKAHK